MEKLIFTTEHLDKVTKQWAESLVGRVLKRVETEPDINRLRKQIKDVIYENVRDLKINIKAFNWGVKFTSGNKR